MKHINLKKITFYIINLKEDEERRQFMEQQMKDLDLQYQFVPGIRVKPSPIGIALSHQKILKLKNLQLPFAILEDDCQFFYEKFNPILSVPEEVDGIYLGHSTFGVRAPDQYGLQWGQNMKAEYKSYNEGYIQILSMLARHCIIYVSEKFRQGAIEANFKALLNNDFPHPGDMAYAQIQKEHLLLSPKEPWCYQSEKHFGNHNATKHALVDRLPPIRKYKHEFVKDKFPFYRKSFYTYKENGILYFQDNSGSGNRNTISIQQIIEANEEHNFSDFPLTFIYTDCYSDQPKETEVKKISGIKDLQFLSYSGTSEISTSQLVPDSYFSAYREIGVNNYTKYCDSIVKSGSQPSTSSNIGWFGTIKNVAVGPNKVNPRAILIELSKQHSDIIDANPVVLARNYKVSAGFVSLPEQVKKSKYLIDVEGHGYSPRIKFLLFSKRVLFIQERPWTEWYFRSMEPYVHYIPVKRDLSDLLSQYQWIEANPDKYQEIAAHAHQFALQNFTKAKILERWKEVIGKEVKNSIVSFDKTINNGIDAKSSLVNGKNGTQEVGEAEQTKKSNGILTNGTNKVAHTQSIFSENIMGHSFLTLFQENNSKHQKYFVFHIGARGFFAEITSVARAAIFAHCHQVQLVLVHDDFGFRYQKGWADYFSPFCQEYDAATMEKDVVYYCKAVKPGKFMRELTAHMPKELSLGPYSIQGFQETLRFFIQMISRPADHIRQLIDKSVQSLGISDRNFSAIHIRRGDKVGWEDTFYPVDIYLDYLEKMKGNNLPLFVMSDDYKAVEEIQNALTKRNSNIQIKTLCQPENTGFDVWALRKKQKAYRHDNPEEEIEKQAFLLNTYENACTLMVETYIAAMAKVFIGTRRSNVSYMIRALHEAPKNCFLLNKKHLEAVKS